MQNLASLLLQSRQHVSAAQDGGAEVVEGDKWALEEKAEKLLLQAIDLQPEHFPSLAQYAQLRKPSRIKPSTHNYVRPRALRVFA